MIVRVSRISKIFDSGKILVWAHVSRSFMTFGLTAFSRAMNAHAITLVRFCNFKIMSAPLFNRKAYRKEQGR